MFCQSFSVGQEYVLHANSEWRRKHCFRYHSYLTTEIYGLSDAVAFTYGKIAELLLRGTRYAYRAV